MSIIAVDYGTIQGGGDITYEFKQVTWPGNSGISIPTSKKARGLCISIISSNQEYAFICLDGVNGNHLYRQYTEVAEANVFTFNNNSISTSDVWGPSATTLYCWILY